MLGQGTVQVLKLYFMSFVFSLHLPGTWNISVTPIQISKGTSQLRSRLTIRCWWLACMSSAAHSTKTPIVLGSHTNTPINAARNIGASVGQIAQSLAAKTLLDRYEAHSRP